MGKGAILRWAENKMLARNLRGRGVEIGALWRPFPAPPGVTVWHVDRKDSSSLRQEYPETRTIVRVDVVADAAHLPFANGALDFIIASHILEHLHFPLAALENWYSTLRPRGVLVLKIPDKRYTFDRDRARTSLQHLIGEQAHPESFDKRAHLEDWVRHVGHREPGSTALREETDHLLHMDYSIHYHVWTGEDVRELIRHTQEGMGMKWSALIFFKSRFYRKECAVALRRD